MKQARIVKGDKKFSSTSAPKERLKESVSLLLNGPGHIMTNGREKVKVLGPWLDFFSLVRSALWPLSFLGLLAGPESETSSTLQEGKLSSNKSMGPSKMHLRELTNVILRLLSNTFERRWQLGMVKKKKEKKAGIIPIFKKGMMQETKGRSALS